MLTLKQIRDDKEAAIRKLAKKGVDAAPVIEKIETLDDRRKAIQVELDNTLAAQNKAAKEIGALMGQGRREEAEERKRFVADLKEKSNRLQAESREVQEELQAAVDRSAEALRSLDAGVLRLLLGAVKEGGIDPFVAPVMELWRYVSGEAIVEACVASIEVTKEVEECELRENGVVWRKSGVLLRIEKNRDNGLTVQWKGDA